MTTQLAQHSTANNSKVGTVINFLEVPNFKDDLRLYYVQRTIKDIQLTKSGKRVIVEFTDGYVISDQSPNTTFQQHNDKFVKEIAAERGWK